MGDYLDTLSQFVAATRYKDLSQEAVAAVRDVTLDTLGAILAGSELSENAALAQMTAQRSGPATATIFGHPLKAEPMLATMANATAGVALEMDEGNRFGGGHPAIHSVPGAVAVAEEVGASGRQLIESIVVGYEVESRLGGATRLRYNVHPHGDWGVIGTAVAVAKAKGYDAAQVRSVINVAAGMSPANSWTPCFEGATIRNAYPGRSGLMGIMAVHMHECGYTGVHDGPTDIFANILGDSFDKDAVVAGLGDGYRVQQNYFKFYACCRINHPSLEATLEACQGEDFAPEDVKAVDISIGRDVHEGMLSENYPSNMLGAKFNVPYAVAAAIVRGGADVTAFYSQAINDERIRKLAGRVNIKVAPELSEDGHLARALIQLQDQRVLEGTTGNTVKGDYGNRVPRQDLLDKFHFLSDGILGQERARAVVKTVDRLEELPDVRELTSLLGG